MNPDAHHEVAGGRVADVNRSTERAVKSRRPIYRILWAEVLDWITELVGIVPARIGSTLRSAWYRHRLGALGRDSRFETGISFTSPENITIGNDVKVMHGTVLFANGDGTIKIGDRVSINRNVAIDAAERGHITIGSDVQIGSNVVLRASDHRFDDWERPINTQGHTGGTIVIEEDVWLGANVVVVGGVIIGAHSVVGAGAVVTRDLKSYSVAVGVPARAIADRRTATRGAQP